MERSGTLDYDVSWAYGQLSIDRPIRNQVLGQGQTSLRG
jgi:hypothetical protein